MSNVKVHSKCRVIVLFVFLFICWPIYYINFYVDLDYKSFITQANYSYLSHRYHVTKLQSYFKCSNSNIKLLVVITSNVSNFYRRETIRRTWGKTISTQKNQDFRTFFAVGKSKDKLTMEIIERESTTNQDVIFGDYFESFNNLSLKVETIIEWAYKHCTFEYLLKADDDVFINLARLFEMLKYSNIPATKVYMGRAQFNANALRYGKYKVSKKEYSKKTYPPFCAGGAILFSQDVVKYMIPYFRTKPFRLDDIYISMMIMNGGIEATNNEDFRLTETSCEYNNESISLHAKSMTDTRSCILSLYYSMLLHNLNDDFINYHYIYTNLLPGKRIGR